MITLAYDVLGLLLALLPFLALAVVITVIVCARAGRCGPGCPGGCGYGGAVPQPGRRTAVAGNG